ncbi:MAG TPA: transposase [Ktedonobacterales bacterium]|jgi:putative transposase|nr:transposase [Ktedonobacterales bacterium]
MWLVEQHVIRDTDQRYAPIDRAAFASKNLYNAANYLVRQSFIHERVYLNFVAVYHRIKEHEAYCALPRKVSNDVLRQLDHDWRAFFANLEAWQEDPSRFLGQPHLPGYKDKQKGRNLLIYDIQAISLTGLRRGEVIPSQLGISVRTKQTTVQQVRIVPRKGYYVVEIVYEREPVPAAVNPSLYAGIDIGLNTLAALTSNKAGFIPRIVNGRPVKSINQFYNKRKAKLQRKLGGTRVTKQMERLTAHRTRQIDHYLHTASRRIIDLLVAEGIGTLCIGKNLLWKQEANMGQRNNQNFVAVPHARFIEMLAYKAELVGIQVKITEESYTSKASFLDADPLPIYGATDFVAFSGKRVKRGLYRAADGRHINADVNGSYNIIRKVLPDAFDFGAGKGIAGAAVHPVRLPVRTKRVA